MVKGEPRLARRVLVEIKRQRCQDAVSRIMRAQATRDPMTDAAMLTALKGALGDSFNKAQMNGVLSNLRSEYKRKDAGTGAPPQTVDDNGRPIIYIGDTGFERSCSLVWNAVRDENASTPYYFRNADVLSRLKRTEDGEIVAQALEVKDVRYELNRLCAWFRIKPYIGLPISTSADNDVVQEVFATPRIDVPVLKAITRVPTFAPNGRLVMADGFDKESGIYYHPTPGFTPLPVSLRPTADDVQRARDLIFCELLRDFPLTDDYLGTDTLPIYLEQKDADGWPLPNLQRGQAARANALAMILHPHLATIIDDTTPMYMVDATLPASGKGFLTNCVTFISEGRVSAKRPAMKDTYQMRVAITAALLARRSTFLLDNINHHLDDEILANALTAGVWEDRILGGSKDVSIPLRLQFMITMNQGTMTPELLRRTCPIRLDPQVADADLDRPPESFKHWPFQPWALENRARLLWAVQTLIGHWFACGCPDGKPVLPSFERWSRVMGGVLGAAGVEGFLGNVKNLRTQRDDGTEAERAFVQEWFHRFRDKEVVVDDIYFTSGTAGLGNLEFKYPLIIDVKDFDDRDPRRRLGRRLTKMTGKTYFPTDASGGRCKVVVEKTAANHRGTSCGVCGLLVESPSTRSHQGARSHQKVTRVA